MSDVITIIGIVVSVSLFFWSSWLLRRSLTVGLQIDVRKTIDRIARNKEKVTRSGPEALKEFDDIQNEPEAISDKLSAMFGIPKVPTRK